MAGYLKRRREIAVCMAVLSSAVIASAQELAPPKIDHILLEVADLRKSIAFYHDLLGLEIKIAEQRLCDVAIRKRGRFSFQHSLGLGREASGEFPSGVGDVSAFRCCRCCGNRGTSTQSRIQDCSGTAEI
jgi:hypothetical protein